EPLQPPTLLMRLGLLELRQTHLLAAWVILLACLSLGKGLSLAPAQILRVALPRKTRPKSHEAEWRYRT
ncbi:hypothetical protein O181_005774, partial [Austropuccinia psidii MF-1]|nr:hypothetical protein [Austropuccinia psidii MF-1]